MPLPYVKERGVKPSSAGAACPLGAATGPMALARYRIHPGPTGTAGKVFHSRVGQGISPPSFSLSHSKHNWEEKTKLKLLLWHHHHKQRLSERSVLFSLNCSLYILKPLNLYTEDKYFDVIYLTPKNASKKPPLHQIAVANYFNKSLQNFSGSFNYHKGLFPTALTEPNNSYTTHCTLPSTLPHSL